MKHGFTMTLAPILAIALLCLGACRKSDSFSVDVHIDGLGARTLTLTYYAAGGLQRSTATASDDGATFKGLSPSPALATLALSDGTPLAILVVQNGDKITLQGSLEQPWVLKANGNKASAELAKWCSDHAQALASYDVAVINRAVAQTIKAHPDQTWSAALLAACYHTPGYELQADSLLSMLDDKLLTPSLMQNYQNVLSNQLGALALPKIDPLLLYTAHDSVVTVNPSTRSFTLLCFMPEGNGARDSVVHAVRSLTQLYNSRRLMPVEISMASDSAQWRNSLRGDTVTWQQTWAPATAASRQLDRLAVPACPYFIVADSTGAMVLRTPAVSDAVRYLESAIR